MTGTGRTVAIAGGMLVIVGVLTGYPELVGCGAACLAALVVARVLVRACPAMTFAYRLDPTRIAEGQASRAVLTATNIGPRRSPPLLVQSWCDGQSVVVGVPSLAPGASYRAAHSLEEFRRGVYAIGPVSVARCDPLRLVAIPQARIAPLNLRVHPRTFRLSPVPRGRSHSVDGRTLESSPRGGVAFHSLRKYETGNDLRLVHWKASARAGTLMVRNNVVPTEPRLTVVLDTDASGYTTEAFEQAVRVAASLCVSACDGGIPVWLRTTHGDTVRADQPASGRGPLLDFFALVRVSAPDPGLVGLAGFVPGQAGLSLIVVTGQPGHDSLAAILALRRRYTTVTVVQVGDPKSGASTVTGAVLIRVGSADDFQSVWQRVGVG